MKLYYSFLSDVGNVRTINEDCFFAGKIGGNAYLFIVADGMGGHSAGGRDVVCGYRLAQHDQNPG